MKGQSWLITRAMMLWRTWWLGKTTRRHLFIVGIQFPLQEENNQLTPRNQNTCDRASFFTVQRRQRDDLDKRCQ